MSQIMINERAIGISNGSRVRYQGIVITVSIRSITETENSIKIMKQHCQKQCRGRNLERMGSGSAARSARNSVMNGYCKRITNGDQLCCQKLLWPS